MRRLIPLSIVLAVLLVSKSYSWSDDKDVTQRDGVHQKEHYSPYVEVLKRMDRNWDGILEPQEIPKIARSFVADVSSEAALDHKGPISLHRLQSRTNLRHHHVGLVEVIHRLDCNLDGCLHPNEIPNDARELVQQVTMEAGHRPDRPIHLQQLHHNHLARFAKLPDNHYDGSNIKGHTFGSEKEALVPAQNLISIYDKNNDKVLHKREWTELHHAWGEDDGDNDKKLTDTEVARKLHLYSRR